MSEGNQAGTISGKLKPMLRSNRVNLQMEFPMSYPLIKRVLKGVARSHVAVGTPKVSVAQVCEVVGRSGPGLVVGPGRVSLLDASRVGPFLFLWRGRTKSSPRLPD